MMKYGHRHKHAHDGIIIHYIMKGSMSMHRNDWRRWFWSFYPKGNQVYVIQPQTFTQLWHEIQKRDNKGVSKTTVSRHLNRMVAEHVLVRSPKIGIDPKTGRNTNQSPYTLHRKKWAAYMVYLIDVIQRHNPNSNHLFFERFGASLSTYLRPRSS